MTYREGIGMGAIEAMAYGLLIVTSNVHGINDYSDQGVIGYKCAPNDIKAFANAIETLENDEGQRYRMGCYNRNLVEKYSVNKNQYNSDVDIKNER